MTPDTIQELRRTSYQISQAIAPGWERWRAHLEDAVAPVREWMIRELGPQPGDTLLELAAGAGDTGFEAAAIAGRAGRLISTDFSPAMLAVARRRGAELGLGNVDFQVIDAERTGLGTHSVDGVLCRFGYMLMTDPAAALAESRRVLRPGGRLVLAVWDNPQRNPFFAVIAALLAGRGHLPPPGPGALSPFSMASHRRTRELLEAAGFGVIAMEEIAVRFPFGDIEEYLTFAADTAGPAAIALRGLSQEERQDVKARLEDAFAPFVTQRGYEVPGFALAAAAS
jgi:ubiquinone/menaquinone biosynthesis C-methylase UbiE